MSVLTDFCGGLDLYCYRYISPDGLPGLLLMLQIVTDMSVLTDLVGCQ